MTTRPVRVFTAFDYDHDESLRNLLMGQAKHTDTPFEMHDWSVKEPFTGDWKAKVRSRIRSVDQVIVLCGEHTHMATGVDVELAIAKEEGKPIFFCGDILIGPAQNLRRLRVMTRFTNGPGTTSRPSSPVTAEDTDGPKYAT
jgi:hypothetical protein